MATETASTVCNGYIALLLCVVLATFGHTAMAECTAAESAALLRFKSALINTDGDLATWDPASGNCCKWKGIKCSTAGVEAIDLTLNAPASNDFVETDSKVAEASSVAGDALAALPHLSSLRTNGPLWKGPLLLSQLVAAAPLRELVITNGGHLPSDIGTFGGTLERLVVSGTSYITGLPSSVCKLMKLKVLELSATGLPSLGPSCLGQISSLEEVRMMNNKKATGGLPVWPTSLPNLKVLDLSNNAHSGNIPVQYGKLAYVDLHLGGNHLSSRIPAGLSSKPESIFRPGNEKLCGAPLAPCPVY